MYDWYSGMKTFFWDGMIWHYYIIWYYNDDDDNENENDKEGRQTIKTFILSQKILIIPLEVAARYNNNDFDNSIIYEDACMQLN